MATTKTASDAPIVWRNILIVVAVGKAAVAGAGLGLALLGALDFASAIAAKQWLTEVQREYAFDAVAVGGGILGTIVGSFAQALTR